MTFTLRETLWLAEHGFDDLLLAYPTRRPRRPRAARRAARGAPAGPGRRLHRAARPADGAARARACIEIDLAYALPGGRSKSAPSARRSARPSRPPRWRAEILRPAGLRAGRDHGLRGAHRRRRRPPRGKPLMGAAIRTMQKLSAARDRRAPRRGRRGGRAVAPLADRQRRRHRHRRGERRRARGHRGHGRLGLLRPHPLRPLLDARAAPGGDVRAAGRAQAERRASPPRSAAATPHRAPPTRTSCPSRTSRTG